VILLGLAVGRRNAMAFTSVNPGKVDGLVIVKIGPDTAPNGAERAPRMAGGATEAFVSPDVAAPYCDPEDRVTRAGIAAIKRREKA
jgi:hypothetical protein